MHPDSGVSVAEPPPLLAKTRVSSTSAFLYCPDSETDWIGLELVDLPPAVPHLNVMGQPCYLELCSSGGGSCGVMYRSTFCDSRNSRKTICTFKMDTDDYVNITYPLGFAIEQTIPEMHSRCNASCELCAKETGSSEFTMEGTFNGAGITRIVFSDGIQQATLFIKNATDVDPVITQEANVTDPAILKITDYEIEAATVVSLPFITKNPTATAYEVDKAVPNIFGLPTYADCKYSYVCITKTGGSSEFTMEGTFNGAGITRIVFSDGIQQATLFIKNATDVDPVITQEANVTDPAILKITDYEIEAATVVSLPFITKNPTATAYEVDKAVPNIFGLPTYADCKYSYVCITKTGAFLQV
ncbi:hypothetical protein EGR_10679 [Echinococcus granulosus]|uniref:Uncharacterized protein n=1 Tax=Echinococcus granulosus TaxID=6210 RepID=W6U1R8_ECHGR|nr:hypothetical protein EGR_10679 [Echinococcus granulosus]EUB54466.1 hypothetical protein EGR_10679 [Echinococcus granulosus]